MSIFDGPAPLRRTTDAPLTPEQTPDLLAILGWTADGLSLSFCFIGIFALCLRKRGARHRVFMAQLFVLFLNDFLQATLKLVLYGPRLYEPFVDAYPLNMTAEAVGMLTNALDANSCTIELHIAMAFALGCAGWTTKSTMCVATPLCLVVLVVSWLCLWRINGSWPCIMSLLLGCVIVAYVYGSYALRHAPRQLRRHVLRRAFSYVANFSMTILPLMVVRYIQMRMQDEPLPDEPLQEGSEAFKLCGAIARDIYGLNGFCNVCVYAFWWYCSRRPQPQMAEGFARPNAVEATKSLDQGNLTVLENQAMFDFFDLEEDLDSSAARRLVAAAVAEARETRRLH